MPQPPRGSKFAPSPIAQRAAELAGIDLPSLGEVSRLSKSTPLSVELGQAWLCFQWQLLPLVDAVYRTRARVGSEMKDRRSSQLGRPLTCNEESNLRTGALTATKDLVLARVSSDPDLLDDPQRLALLVQRDAQEGVLPGKKPRKQRRPNGQERPAARIDDLGRLGLDEIAYPKHYKQWLGKANRALNGGARGVDPADLVQSAFLHVATQDRAWAVNDFDRAVLGQIDVEAATAFADNRIGADHDRPIESIDTAPFDGTAGSPLDRTQPFDESPRLYDSPEAAVDRLGLHSAIAAAIHWTRQSMGVSGNPVRIAACDALGDVIGGAESCRLEARLDVLGSEDDRQNLIRYMAAAAISAVEPGISESTARGHTRFVLGEVARHLAEQTRDSFE